MPTEASCPAASDGAAWSAEFDLIVLGSGAAGMTAALVASTGGLRTLVLERSPVIGGTTARSSGTVWIPDNPGLRRLGVIDDAAAARTYLDALTAGRSGDAERALRDTFLQAGPEMIAALDQHSDVRFSVYPQHPDYRQDQPGAAQGGRPLEPLAFDGRLLGNDFARLGWPLRELMLFGGMMVTRGEAVRLLRVLSSWDGFALATRLVGRYLRDRLRHRRGTRLVLGNALAARLLHGLRLRKVPVWCDARTVELVREAGRVTGVLVEHGGALHRLHARRGVVLAGGGFPASATLRAQHLPAPTPQYTPAFEGCTGQTIQLGLAAGAALGPPTEDNALWFPSSVARRADGSTAVYPHIVLDRAKPGLVAVNAAGRRFVNEAVSYHEFTRAMFRANRKSSSIPAWLVCDRRFVWNYGLGMIRPRTPSLRRYVRDRYLHVAPTLEGLAEKIGVDAAGLIATVRANNARAQTGIDEEFGRGGNSYDRANGDVGHAPNPCLGPIAHAPYCAVAVVPTPLGTSLGLRTNVDAQVCDAHGGVIEGLYACGNDMQSIFCGEYPGAGSQLGPAMTFGYVAARHASRRPVATAD
jgi:3-oxosteroid 1-dehydrogenase